MNRSVSKPDGEVRATFFMEQHIGHKTYYQNLRRFIDSSSPADLHIVPCWVEITYKNPRGLMRYLPFPKGRLRDILIGREQVMRGLKELYDVAFFNTQIPAVINLENIRRRPYVLSTDITPIQYDKMGIYYGHTPEQGGAVSRWKYRMNSHLFRDAAHIIPWSGWTAQSLVADYGVPPERIAVISPGVDLQWWQPCSGGYDCHSNGKPLRILFVGGDLFRKGGETLVRAFRQLLGGEAELAMVTHSEFQAGEGIHIYQDLQPNSPELLALYRSSDVFVLPSIAEAFGIAAIEASAAGLPVIATQVGGLSDIVVDGETGFLIQPEEDQALADRLRQLIQRPDLRQRMGRAARARAEELFDAQKNAKKILKILHETVCTRNGL